MPSINAAAIVYDVRFVMALFLRSSSLCGLLVRRPQVASGVNFFTQATQLFGRRRDGDRRHIVVCKSKAGRLDYFGEAVPRMQRFQSHRQGRGIKVENATGRKTVAR